MNQECPANEVFDPEIKHCVPLAEASCNNGNLNLTKVQQKPKSDQDWPRVLLITSLLIAGQTTASTTTVYTTTTRTTPTTLSTTPPTISTTTSTTTTPSGGFTCPAPDGFFPIPG